MNKRIVFGCAVVLAWLAGTATVRAQMADGVQDDAALVYVIEIRQEIDRTAQIYLANGLAAARAEGAAAVVIHLNTYGGLMDAADSMRTAVLYHPVPVYVYIDNNAASAGALVALACRGIFMRRGASMGAATVVDQAGAEAPDKYQSYMRSLMRATAEAHGRDTVTDGTDTVYRWRRDPRIAEAMVGESATNTQWADSGKTLTLTAEEAVAYGYCDGIAESVDEVIGRELGMVHYRVAVFKPAWQDTLRGFLMNPVLQSVLILMIIGGIYFELQSPGVGFPLAAAVVAAVLYFAPLYVEGLAEHWEILVFVAGLVLVALEVFVFPGFGVSGAVGIALSVAGFYLCLVDNVAFDFSAVGSGDSGRATLTVVSGVLVGSLAALWLTDRIGRKGFLHRVALDTDLGEAVTTPAMPDVCGREGLTLTVLRPSGKTLVDGVLYDSISESGYVEPQTRVRVVRCEQAQIYVETVAEC